MTQKNFNQNIGSRIKQARKSTSLTQAVAAESIGIARDTYSRIERGEISTTLRKLADICELFNVSSDYLLFGRGDNNETALGIEFKFEQLDNFHQRVKVHGGWLVKSYSYGSNDADAMLFVPDPNHEWKVHNADT